LGYFVKKEEDAPVKKINRLAKAIYDTVLSLASFSWKLILQIFSTIKMIKNNPE
jgi:hypothetical protein